jgi:hypothetical protein
MLRECEVQAERQPHKGIDMIEIGAAIKSAEELDNAVGIIAKLVSKLKAQPDIAAQKLCQPLGEVAKTLQVVDQAASEYLLNPA